MNQCWHPDDEETETEWYCPDCGSYEKFAEEYETMGGEEF